MFRRTLFAHLETMRPYTTVYVGLVAAAGALIADRHPPATTLAVVCIAPVLGWTAGLYGGDYFDRRLDAVAKPQRPIPSGRISPGTALAFMIGYVVIGLLGSAWLSWANLLVALSVLGLEIAYSKVFKAHGVAGHFVRGMPMSLTLVFGSLGASGQVQWSLLLLSLAFLFHDACTNMIGAVRDIDGDRSCGYMTFPARYGIRNTIWAGALLHALGLGLVANGIVHVRDGKLLPGLLLLAMAATAASIVFVRLWKRQDSLSRVDALWAHKVFVMERLYFACSLIACAIGIGATLVILMPSIFFTLLSQARLRDRYEFGARGEAPQTSNDDFARTSRLPATSNTLHPIWGKEEALAYLERQVTRLDRLPSLRNWPRRLQIRLEDVGVTLHLTNTAAGEVTRVTEQEYLTCSYTELLISTDSRAFREIFIDGTLSPIAAYRSRLVRLRCSPLDMVRLNTVFRALRATDANRTQLEVSAVPVSAAKRPEREDDFLKDDLKQAVVVADTTLRDGEQAPGVAFSVPEKIALATTLDALRIPLIEVGFPAVSAVECDAIREIVNLRLQATIQVIARPLERDIDAAIKTGATSVAIFIGTSDSHIVSKLRTTRSQVLKVATHAIEYAKQANVQIVFAPEDATRTEWDFLLEVSRAAVDAGADVLGVPDTTGAMTPARMFRLVRHLASSISVPIAVHCHNDLGLATANSIAGLLAGASGAQCSLLGIGERAGNAALEEVATILEVAYSCNTGIDLTRLPQATHQLSQILGWPQLPHKAVVGTNAFVHESGLHTDGVVRDPATYESFSPERVGQQRKYVFGKHSGRSAIRHVLEARGLPCDDALCGNLLEVAKQLGQAKRPMDEDALVHLALEERGRSPISSTGIRIA